MSWMDLEEFCHLYPSFQLEDELILEGGRDVMWGLAYSLRKVGKTTKHAARAEDVQGENTAPK
jgi:hypothetical protein